MTWPYIQHFFYKKLRDVESFGIRARLSEDDGATWSAPSIPRDDGGGMDIGYVRSVVRADGTVLSVYDDQDRSGPDRYIAATIWDPGGR